MSTTSTSKVCAWTSIGLNDFSYGGVWSFIVVFTCFLVFVIIMSRCIHNTPGIIPNIAGWLLPNHLLLQRRQTIRHRRGWWDVYCLHLVLPGSQPPRRAVDMSSRYIPDDGSGCVTDLELIILVQAGLKSLINSSYVYQLFTCTSPESEWQTR